MPSKSNSRRSRSSGSTTTIDRNPEILEGLVDTVGDTLGQVGELGQKALGPGGAVSQTLGDVGKTAEQALGPGGAVGQLGESAGQALGGLGQAAGGTLGQVAGGQGGNQQELLQQLMSQLGAARELRARLLRVKVVPSASVVPEHAELDQRQKRDNVPKELRAGGTYEDPRIQHDVTGRLNFGTTASDPS